MTKVDFYLIRQPEEQDRQFFACRLAEKVCGQGMKIYIHTASEEQAQLMDDLLWSFKPESFIPHAILGLDPEIDADEEIPVFIGYGEQYSGDAGLMINLGEGIPAFHDRFERIAEIVPNADTAKAVSREHWNRYKDQGYELAHHEV